MCTIYTFDLDTFSANYTAITSQIAIDSSFNSDGASLLTDTGVLIRSIEDGDGVSTMLDALDNVRWNRVWLHLRAATTGYVGIDGCHGFAGGRGVFVFHNGILRSKLSANYQVDSELIAKATEKLGVAKTVGWLQRNEGYANVFLVDTIEGEYHVVRNSVGSLFSDGCGNYSTYAIAGVIDIPVPSGSQDTWFFTPPAQVKRSKYFKYG